MSVISVIITIRYDTLQISHHFSGIDDAMPRH